MPEGNPLVATLSLDLSGLLKVTAMEKLTGLSKTVTMYSHDQDAAFDLESARANVQSLLEGNTAADWQKLKEHTDALSDLVFYLED